MKTKPFSLAFLAIGMLCAGATSLLAQAPKVAKEGKKAENVPTTIKPLWQKKLPPFGIISEDEYDVNGRRERHEWWQNEFKAVQEFLAKNPRPILPPFFPVARGNQLLLSSYAGTFAITLVQHKYENTEFKPGDLYWFVEMQGSLIEMVNDGNKKAATVAWKGGSENCARLINLPYGHTLNGTIAVNEKLAAVIDDLGLLPSPKSLVFERLPITKPVFGPFSRLVNSSYLVAIELETGKLFYKLGGFFKPEDNPLKLMNCHFLSSPVYFKNRCFLITEQKRELSLLCLNTTDRFLLIKDDEPAEKKFIHWQTKLVTAPESVVYEPTRRIHALNIVLADDMLICPTHLGILFAVDAKKGDILWSHRYADEMAKRFEDFSTTWKVSAPIVLEDRVLYAPPDAEMLLCLNRKDGKVLWQVDRGTGLFPATVHDGKLLIVEEQSLRAISPKDGKEAWKQSLPGFPVGRGVVVGTRYYLPLGTNGKKPLEPQIGIYEMADGKHVGTLHVTKDTLPLGNLIVHNGQIISQSIEGVAVFELPK